jgi:hypothetical protein
MGKRNDTMEDKKQTAEETGLLKEWLTRQEQRDRMDDTWKNHDIK